MYDSWRKTECHSHSIEAPGTYLRPSSTTGSSPSSPEKVVCRQADGTRRVESVVEELACEMDGIGGGQDADYCLDFSDIVGDEAPEDAGGASEPEVGTEQHDDPAILRRGLSSREPALPEFSIGCRGCDEEFPRGGSKHVASLLRLDYDDVLSSWCEDRSLWTDGKRPQTVPEYFPVADPGLATSPRNDFGLVPELGSHSQTASTIPDYEDGSRGARVTRYREKKRSRLFAKRIRYEVRKVNAEGRPRMKGRFVKRTSKLR